MVVKMREKPLTRDNVSSEQSSGPSRASGLNGDGGAGVHEGAQDGQSGDPGGVL